ncbi:MAG: DNA mismatch repair protein MutS [Bacteroidetes bacterium]|nr:DNA mismatch repair protein MutS [Bacteroidota bacterium]
MQVDKTTLADLSIFHSEEEQSVFFHLNHTQTNVGREYLRYLLAHPLQTLQEISDTQLTIRQLMQVAQDWPITITNGNIMVMERFYDSQINTFPSHPNRVNSLFYKILNSPDYSLIRYTVEHAIDFTAGLQKIVDLLQEQPNLSKQLTSWITRMSMLLGKNAVQELIREDKKQLQPEKILYYGGFLRNHFKNQSVELVELYSRFDAYLSVAKACSKYGFCFPEIAESKEPFIKTNGLYHMLLQMPVSYDIELTKDRNFLFLTGANMAGKSTFIKAVGVAVYLAHLGMGVPAKQMQLSLFDGLLSNIQVVDNIIKGESFFFNEVQRIKNTIEKISDGRNWLILIDELFKGTNQQDAVKCSTTVIEGLRKMQNALFVLSTHLYEIGDDLKKYENIQFHYFETSVKEDQLVFSYQLKQGISNDRLGYLILKKEGVVDLLDKL